MSTYVAPVKDMLFAMNELAGLQEEVDRGVRARRHRRHAGRDAADYRWTVVAAGSVC